MSATRYRLLCRIGSGILAESFRAEREDGTPVVVKLFQAGTAEDRYAREIAEVARRLLPFRMPGICQVIDIGYAAGRLAVVRERHDDFNLGQVLSRMTKWGIIFPTPLALWVLCELLDAVRRAHAAGVIHGGIAPGNVLIDEDGQPSLCDFGALPALYAAPELKARFVPAGRGSYRSQEVERGEAPTQRSDVFSLGAVAYQLLTLHEVSPVRPDPKSPSSADGPGSQLDQRLYPILMKGLETIPQLRYPSCGEFAEALQAYLEANRLTPNRHELHKLLLDLFPEGPRLESDNGRLPFPEPFLLDPIRGIAPLERPPRDEWPLPSAPASTPELKLEGFGADWYAPPAGEGDQPSAAAPSLAAAVKQAEVPTDGAFAAPAPPDAALQPPADVSARKWLWQQKALGFAGFLLIAGSFAIALSLWRPEQAKSRLRPSDAPPALAAERAERTDPPSVAAVEPPVAPAASLQPGGSRAAHTEERLEWDSPPARGGGYLFLSSDLPAVVYVDGRRVREPAPLKRYPVQVGVRKISVVAPDTNERRDFVVHFSRGQIRKIDSSFEPSSARR